MSAIWIFIIAIHLHGISVYCLTPDEIEAQKSGWNIDPNTQYHIQTDEGSERYFRYQTLNGQFRKEKRLEDGTVIGTEGWLDPLGYLRIKDYIADREGFRILKSKTIYVGKNTPIDDAVTASKQVPAQTGTLVKPRRPPNPFRQSSVQEISSNSIESNTIKPYRRYPSAVDSARKYVASSTTPYPRSTYYSTTITPIAITNNGYNDISTPITNYVQPTYQVKTPYNRSYRKPYSYVTGPAVKAQSLLTDDHGNHFEKEQSIKVTPISTYGIYRPDSRRYRAALASGRFNNTNSQPTRGRRPIYAIEKTDSRAKESNRVYHVNGNTRNRPVRRPQNHPVTPEYKFPAYDGSSKTSDGFQYYLKSHYHEEEQQPDKTIGSFGYVDPFGIRRVVYYKADGENGFIHKKNNRYVGFNATPYDPVPLKQT